MANTSNVLGLKPVGTLTGTNTGRVRRYYIPSTDSTAVFVGDAVKSAGSSDAIEGVPTVAQAAAGDTLRGVVVGIDPVDGVAANSIQLGINYRPASTAMYVLVNDDPNTIYEVQEDAVGATTALIDVGENADIVVGAGDTVTGASGMQLDSSDHKTATAQLRILGFARRCDNEPASANAKLLVIINEHELKSTTGV